MEKIKDYAVICVLSILKNGLTYDLVRLNFLITKSILRIIDTETFYLELQKYIKND